MTTLIRTLVVVGCWIAVVAPPRPAAAQLTAADSAAVLLAAAEGLRGRGEVETSEVMYGLIVESFPGTSSAEAAQAWLGDVLARRSWARGRVELKVWSTLYGLWQGVAIPAALGSESAEAYGLGILLGGPAGLLIGRQLSELRPYSLGQARAVTWGGTWGAIQGFGWANALNLGGEEYQRYEHGAIVEISKQTERAVLGSMIVGGGLGIVGGMVAARHEITPGASTSAMLGSLWGMWIGAAGITIAGWDPDEDVADPFFTATMLTGNAGLVAGALLGSRVPVSASRARLISLGGMIGGFAGLGINLISDPWSDMAATATTTLATSLAGLAVGTFLTRDRGEDDASNDVEAAASLPAPGALLNWSRGDWVLSTPLPSPVRQPSARRGGRDGLAWKVPLLSVRF